MLIAIQRYYDEIKSPNSKNNFSEILQDSELIMKNKIVSLTLERTKDSLNFIAKLAKKIRWDLGDILFTTQGSGEVTIVLDKKNARIIEKSKLKILEKKLDLSIISLREPEELESYSKDEIGFLSLLTTTLGDNKINIYDIATTYKQIIFVIPEKDLTRAYDVLNNMIQYYKE